MSDDAVSSSNSLPPPASTKLPGSETFIDRVRKWLHQKKVIIGLLVTAVVCIVLFAVRERYFGVGQLLDGRVRGYSASDIETLFDALADRRQLYALTEVSLDVVFPVTYAALFLAALLWAFPAARRLLILPLAAAAADLLENATIAWMA